MKVKIFIIVIISLSFKYSFGQEGNYKLENYGNQSALLTGNVTASISDLALTYYNPSRLTFVDSTKFLISIKAYEFDRFSYENNLGDGKNITDSEFNGIPSMISGEFKLKFLPNHKFAYSLISRYRTDRSLVYESGMIENGSNIGIGETNTSLINIDFHSRLKDEWFGLTWAHKLNDNFSIGASTFLSVYQFREKGELLISELDSNDEMALLSNKLDYEQSAYGLFLKIGMAYKISDIEIGANIDLPYIGLTENASVLVQKLSNGFPENQDFKLYNEKKLENQRKTALGISLGTGIPIGSSKRSKIHLNLDWHSKINEYEKISLPTGGINDLIEQSQFNEEFKSVFNFGIGANFFLTSKFTLFLSASSDFNAYISSVNILNELNRNDENLNTYGDFWHYSLGTDMTTKWGDLFMGLIYSYTSTSPNPSEPVIGENVYDRAEGVIGGLKYQRIRVIIGIDIPILKKIK